MCDAGMFRSWLQGIFWLGLLALVLCQQGCVAALIPQDTDCVQTGSDCPRMGNVYLIRGWTGLFSWGIDDLARDLKENGVRAHTFRHEQHEELARALVAVYGGAKNPEPLCLVAHSAGSDDALLIARELKQVGVRVDLIVTLDCVDETVVPSNVALCYNYWVPKEDSDSNFLRGLEFQQEPGSTGQLHNVNLLADGRDLCQPGASHITLDKDGKLRQIIVQQVLAVCRPRPMSAAGQSGR